MTKRKGSKAKILDFLLKNIGQKVNSTQLQKASGGKAEWARRLRELRDEEGYEIISHNDNVDLKPGECLVVYWRAYLPDYSVYLPLCPFS